MTIRTNTPNLLDNPPIPVQAKLAAAWTSFMFLYIYVDYSRLLQARRRRRHPGRRRLGVRHHPDLGRSRRSTLLAIPILMVVLSMTLPARVNRITNLIVASVQVPFAAFNAVGQVGEPWMYFYGLGIGTRGAAPGLHPALRLDLATPHRITGDPGSQPRQRATPHAAQA